MRATLLGFTIPDTDFQQILRDDPVMPTQTQKFAWALVDALRQNGVELDLVSTLPVSNFPASPRLLVGRRIFSERGLSGLLLPCVNALVLKHLTRFIACLLFATPRIRQHRSEWLLLHGVHSPFLWYARVVRALLGVPIAAVLSDPPGVVRRSDGLLARVLKRLDIRVTRRALSGFDAVIVLSKPLASDFAPGIPYLVMEGLVALPETSVPCRASGPPRIVYAGGLVQEYGVLNLARAVMESDLDVRVEFYGSGDAAPTLEQFSVEDPRIVAPMLLDPAELQSRYLRASLLVQPRPTDQDFVRYSFPSKLIEYMATGVPVVSTRLPSIPADYQPFVVWADSTDPRGLRQAIETGLAPAVSGIGAEAAAFVRATRSPDVQGRRIRDFLGEVAS
ncbi:hypothetical protein GCM10011584_29040 [Nocardioides phosphati]|uniref:Glycosyltransferase n=1 Tax=Nocardioides phosphati TaxID=1867775 RepID=A0ABQ2NDH8_9ACTN|nr:glycosyltransferase [Nocardioides phosphati]GGO92497.1 hypothetical protein GCM10011584_29040 [Nocardioides phosphati]